MGEGRLCKCDLTINITFSKTAISCFPRRLEQSVSLEESPCGHVSLCCIEAGGGEPHERKDRTAASRADPKSNLHVCCRH